MTTTQKTYKKDLKSLVRKSKDLNTARCAAFAETFLESYYKDTAFHWLPKLKIHKDDVISLTWESSKNFLNVAFEKDRLYHTYWSTSGKVGVADYGQAACSTGDKMLGDLRSRLTAIHNNI